VSDTWK
jgi:hypothetical protein